MARYYRALISLPITADSDAAAISQAHDHAAALETAGQTVLGHVELVGEVREGFMEIIRVVDEDPLFLSQLPPDWKP